MKTADSGEQGRGWGIVAAGVFAIAAGLGEIIVGITGNYLGILSKPLEPSAVTALVGACYSLGGAFILTSKKWGAALGMALIAAEIHLPLRLRCDKPSEMKWWPPFTSEQTVLSFFRSGRADRGEVKRRVHAMHYRGRTS